MNFEVPLATTEQIRFIEKLLIDVYGSTYTRRMRTDMLNLRFKRHIPYLDELTANEAGQVIDELKAIKKERLDDERRSKRQVED